MTTSPDEPETTTSDDDGDTTSDPALDDTAADWSGEGGAVPEGAATDAGEA